MVLAYCEVYLEDRVLHPFSFINHVVVDPVQGFEDEERVNVEEEDPTLVDIVMGGVSKRDRVSWVSSGLTCESSSIVERFEVDDAAVKKGSVIEIPDDEGGDAGLMWGNWIPRANAKVLLQLRMDYVFDKAIILHQNRFEILLPVHSPPKSTQQSDHQIFDHHVFDQALDLGEGDSRNQFDSRNRDKNHLHLLKSRLRRR
ncbi:hypothetical protein L2E82_06242 [Cichorium intybus]|uniref:Uncharacterized protein n=1 Tax=Cichorium intybus TaxID=13427 RepID=A0ACB9HB05_CICIN|nr:hypothetical protein L2E82_06242 [Cichorium intybus]